MKPLTDLLRALVALIRFFVWLPGMILGRRKRKPGD